MSVAIGTFISFLSFDGKETGLNFQNFFPGESRSYRGRTYTYGGFGYSGTTTDLDPGSVSAILVFATSQLLLNQMKAISNRRDIVEVTTVWLDPNSLAPTGLFLNEVFAVLGFDHDLQRTDVRLGDPLNAIDASIPREILTRRLVGSLPASGNVPLS